MSSTRISGLFVNTTLSVNKVAVIQSLADNDPDVDAVYRMTQPLPFNFAKSGQPVAVPSNRLSPYNAQATHLSLITYSPVAHYVFA